jgi:para-aminobenzoate synthetase component 1
MKITNLLLPGFNPLQFLCKLQPDVDAPVLMRLGRWTVLAWNPTERITWRRKPKWEQLDAILRSRRQSRHTDLPFIGGLIGYASYDLGYELQGVVSHARDELRFPLLSFGVYDHALCWDGTRLVAIGDAAFRREVQRTHLRPLPSTVIPPMTLTPSVTPREYGHALRRTFRAIRDGEVYQLNYTYAFRGKADGDSRALFSLLARNSPAPFMSYVETEEGALLSLSPEQFVSCRGRHLRTCPIKGTRPRGKTPAEDRHFLRELLRSEKEAAELNMITDLLRNDIGRVAIPGSVRVRAHRNVQKLPSVWHTYSVIEAELARGRSRVDVLRAMLPGGSVTGCPKARAMELIDELEGVRRGPYTGTMIILSDDGSMDSSIIIRTVAVRGNKLWVGVGGGIVHGSTVAAEFDETLRKATPFLALAEGQQRFWIDGRPAASHDARLQNLDARNPQAHGVFETLRVDAGYVRFLHDHLRRLRQSVSFMQIKPPSNLRHIRTFIHRAARACPWESARLKVVCTGRHVLLRTEELILDARESSGIAASVMPLMRRRPGVKALPYHREMAAHDKAVSHGFGEAFLWNSSGFIPEGAHSNVFWVERGELWTPGEGMLPGITRAVVLRLARRLRLSVHFDLPTPLRLRHADEVFLTRTTAGIVPVVRIDRRVIGNGKPGRITRLLQESFEKLLAVRCSMANC